MDLVASVVALRGVVQFLVIVRGEEGDACGELYGRDSDGVCERCVTVVSL